jgi:uncharacterized SAM-binding protein YcdF (DUF218 family)
MFVYLSKLLPLLVYPLGLACIFLFFTLAIRRKPRLGMGLVAAALALLWLGGSNWVATSLSKSLEWRYLPPDQMPRADVIVLLGGGTNSPQYPRQMVELNAAIDRVFYAAWLYHQGAAPRLLLSGGNIDWRGQRESTPAEDMAAVLAMLNVPQDAIWLEGESRNTYENAIYTTQRLEAEGIEDVILVTSALHMPRSIALFKKLGRQVIPAPTDYTVTQWDWERLWEPNIASQLFNFLPSAANLSKTTNALKEYLGMLIYSLRGWI